MRTRHGVLALAAVSAFLTTSAAAASAAAPVPPGCTFAEGPGVLTCTSTSTSTTVSGPFTTDATYPDTTVIEGAYYVPVSTVFGPLDGDDICHGVFDESGWGFTFVRIALDDVSITTSVTTTTTTKRHGLRGRVFETTTTTSAPTFTGWTSPGGAGFVGCVPG